jgi:signal transduction histidine kinase
VRRQLNLLVLAVTSLIVVAFVVPLGLLVRVQADQRGRIEAERAAQTLAAVVVRSAAATDGSVSADGLASAIGPLSPGTLVVLPDGQVLGEGEPNGSLLADVAENRQALSAYYDDGFGLAIPIITRSGVLVVYSFVPNESLTGGVRSAWLLLAALATGLILAALAVADRLGRTVVGPSRRIADAAERLGSGALETRVEPEGPPELVAIATAFNTLAARIRDLLAAEREQVADLSHRLRTPLTALRLQAEQINDLDDRQRMLDKADRVRQSVDELISEARRRPEEGPARCDLAEVVRARVAFWQVLADEQGRKMTVDLSDGPALMAASAREAAAAIDVLIGNVFSHTTPGTGFAVSVRSSEQGVELTVADQGQGFPSDIDPSRRGESGAGSSGLGLDIVRTLAERAGGTMTLDNRPGGGAVVTVTTPALPPAD